MHVVLADTGPLVALLNQKDHHHSWALARFDEFTDPLFTCEGVITETLFLLQSCPGAVESFLSQGYELINLRHVDAGAPDAVVWLRKGDQIELVARGMDEIQEALERKLSEGFEIVEADYNGDSTGAMSLTGQPRCVFRTRRSMTR